MQGYSPTAKERAMKMRDVLLEALAGKITWIQAAEVLGLSPRTMRRWRERFDESGIDGLYDGRRRSPSDRAIPAKTLAKWLRLYRDRYAGYNVRHFCSLARRKHGLTWSYTLMRNALQGAGLVRKRRPRGKQPDAARTAPVFWRAAAPRRQSAPLAGAAGRHLPALDRRAGRCHQADPVCPARAVRVRTP